MAHFAELSANNIVTSVVVIDNEDCLDGDGNESEAVGVTFSETLFGGGTWKQTSYNNNIRKQFAQVGDTYDAVKDKYIRLKPFASWTLNADDDWESPLGAMPKYSSRTNRELGANDKSYVWDEDAYQADNSTGWVVYESGIEE